MVCRETRKHMQQGVGETAKARAVRDTVSVGDLLTEARAETHAIRSAEGVVQRAGVIRPSWKTRPVALRSTSRRHRPQHALSSRSLDAF